MKTSAFTIVGLLLGVALLSVAASTAVSEDASSKQYLSVEEYIELAQPYLHMSCEAAWAAAKEDPEAYVDIIDKLSAIGFLNHDLDIAEVYEQPAEDVDALRVEFYTEVGQLCRKNPHNLLAGVVERALLSSFGKIAPGAVDD